MLWWWSGVYLPWFNSVDCNVSSAFIKKGLGGHLFLLLSQWFRCRMKYYYIVYNSIYHIVLWTKYIFENTIAGLLHPTFKVVWVVKLWSLSSEESAFTKFSGNICRSPTAEAIMQHLVKERGEEHKVNTQFLLMTDHMVFWKPKSIFQCLFKFDS